MHIFCTTRRLVELTLHMNHVSTDTTYKFNLQGFLVLILGTTDDRKSFDSFGLAICKGETSKDYAFMFKNFRVSSEQCVVETFYRKLFWLMVLMRLRKTSLKFSANQKPELCVMRCDSQC